MGQDTGGGSSNGGGSGIMSMARSFFGTPPTGAGQFGQDNPMLANIFRAITHRGGVGGAPMGATEGPQPGGMGGLLGMGGSGPALGQGGLFRAIMPGLANRMTPQAPATPPTQRPVVSPGTIGGPGITGGQQQGPLQRILAMLRNGA